MEASTAGAAPAVAGGDNGQAPAAPGGETAPDLTGIPNPPEQAPDPAADMQARIAAAEKRASDAEQKLQEAQGPSEEPDLLAALEGAEGDLGLSDEDMAALNAGQEPGEANPDQQEQQMQEFKDLIREQVEEARAPEVQERQINAVKAFQKENPDIAQPEVLQRVEATMQNLVAEYGEKARYSLPLIQLAYRGAKAELADAGAVPAEQAADNGASLETGPGQPQTGADSEADQYIKALRSRGDNPLA